MRRGFTLLELLVVIGIISVLASMAMPMIAVARNSAMKGATRAIMGKVDAALHLFREEVRAYPWQASYADVASGAPATNRLAWHLGTTMTTAQQVLLRNDQDAAAKAYFYGYNRAVTAPSLLGNNLNWEKKKEDGGDTSDAESAAGWWESQPGSRGTAAFSF